MLFNEIIGLIGNFVFFFVTEMAENVTGRVAGNISSVYSIIRQKTHDIHDTFESLAMGNDHHRMVSTRLDFFYPIRLINPSFTEIVSFHVNTIIKFDIGGKCFR